MVWMCVSSLETWRINHVGSLSKVLCFRGQSRQRDRNFTADRDTSYPPSVVLQLWNMNGIARSYVVYTIYIYYSPEDMFASIFKQASGAWCEYVATSCLKGMRVAMLAEGATLLQAKHQVLFDHSRRKRKIGRRRGYGACRCRWQGVVASARHLSAGIR